LDITIAALIEKQFPASDINVQYPTPNVDRKYKNVRNINFVVSSF
jgi:hypothetical protein